MGIQHVILRRFYRVTIQTGYKITDIPTLKALTSSQRVDGYARLVESDASGHPSWYLFNANSTITGDDDAVVLPYDSPGSGRWLKSGATRTGFGGGKMCSSGQCAVGGKAFQFYAPQTNLPLIVVPGFDMSIVSGNPQIEIHRWNQQPNTALNGRTYYGSLPDIGGTISLTTDSTYRWISFFARNPSTIKYDGVCFTLDGNVVTLLGYS